MPDHPSLTALVAEDSAKQRDDLIADLTAMGLKPVGAKTGFEALKLVTEHRPDVVFLDALLPEMHGFEIARAIRGLDRNYKPRIVIITGIYKGTQYQNEARLKYGINDYLIKPVKKESLREIIRQLSFPQK